MENINISDLFENLTTTIAQLKIAVVIKEDRIATLEREVTSLIDTIKCSTYSANKVRENLLNEIKAKKLNHVNFGEIVTIADIEAIVSKLNEEQ